ncbi:hypothetical protein AB8A21_24085 [Streptomyces sp. BF23-18]|uniref:hypothetical protein n=1 Tax=Streptomyces sp. BF23-18 TaxID=3240282 RepID=UPI0034E59D9E
MATDTCSVLGASSRKLDATRISAHITIQQAIREIENASSGLSSIVHNLAETRDGRGDGPVQSEIVEGAAQTSALIENISLIAQEEVLGLRLGAFCDEESPKLEPLGRVQARSIHLSSVARSSLGSARIRNLTAIGVKVRLASTLPIPMIIIDSHWVLVSISDPDGEPKVIVLRGNALAKPLREMFQHQWASSHPVASPDPAPEGATIEAHQSVILRGMFDGRKDETVARELGVSTRTHRRMLAELMQQLGAQSRFQAGVIAERNGWLAP